MALESHAGGKVRILQKSIRPPPEPSQGMQILANSGLRNREVCKLNCKINAWCSQCSDFVLHR